GGDALGGVLDLRVDRQVQRLARYRRVDGVGAQALADGVVLDHLRARLARELAVQRELDAGEAGAVGVRGAEQLPGDAARVSAAPGRLEVEDARVQARGAQRLDHP